MADLRDFAQAELMARQNPVPDVGVQVRPTRQSVQALEDYRAGQERNFNWRATFGQIPPADVLRETRDMIALTNRAIEQKMRLAAQTDREAQGIYLKDQEFQEWQRQAPLRDELLKSQIERREALTARDADRQVWANRKEAAQARYDMALESFLRDNPSATTEEVDAFTRDHASRDSGALMLESVRRIWGDFNQRLRQERGITAAGERQATGIAATGERQAQTQAFQAGQKELDRQEQAKRDEQKQQQRAAEKLQQDYEDATDHLDTAQRLRQAAEKLGNQDNKDYADKRVRKAEKRLADIEARMQTATAAPAPSKNEEALKWANENPNDPRAARIKQILGVK